MTKKKHQIASFLSSRSPPDQLKTESNETLPLWKRFIYGVIIANAFHYGAGMVLWWFLLSSFNGKTGGTPDYGSDITALFSVGVLVVAFYVVLLVGLVCSVAAVFRPHKTGVDAIWGGISTILFGYLVFVVVFGALGAFALAL